MAEGEAVTVSEIDVYRSASLLVKQYGTEAPIEAAMKADAMLEKGDLDGQAVWLRILTAVRELLSRASRDGEAIH